MVNGARTLNYRSQLNPIARGMVDRLAMLTQIAFFFAIALVIARVMMLEDLREPFSVSPGSQSYPRGAGPAATLVLDLLCCLPAILILLRRVLDRTYEIRFGFSHLLMGLVAAWVSLSTIWADDRFAAAVGAANIVAAFAMLWAASQLVRSWMSLRLLAAIAYGLLLVNLAKGFYDKFVDMPDTLASYEQNKAKFLADRGWKVDSFIAQQFEKKIVNQELMGFNDSPNAYGAVLVLLGTVAVGLVIQQIIDGEGAGRAIAVGIALPLTGWLLVYTRSKAILVTPILGIGLLAAIWGMRPILARGSRKVYWLGAAIIAMAAAGVVISGLATGRLPSASLNFRWRYWVASAHMFLRHPWIGVGWDNYGLHYLADRLPVAAEEIKDPHNFVIRFFVELGIIGGALLLAWMGRMWWEMTRPALPLERDGISDLNRRNALGLLAIVALAGIGINGLCTIDWTQPIAFAGFEVLQRLLFACTLLLGAAVVAVRSLQIPELDSRPAPWVLYGILVAIGVFLIHNLIEFSFFDAGPLMLFAIFAGGILGLRQSTPMEQSRRTILPAISLFAGTVGWIAAMFVLVIPVVRAEQLAYEGDDSLRAGQLQRLPDIRLQQAAERYREAGAIEPLNSDYAFRAARALFFNRSPVDQVQSLLDQAISANPSDPTYYLTRAQLALARNDRAQLVADFDRALQLNPNEVSIHLDYARSLRQLGMNAQAAQQYQLALKYNDLLQLDEPKRLPPEELNAVRDELRRVESEL